MDKIAIIIPHYNDVARLSRCLSALVPQLGTDDHLIVVDNGSTESLEDVRGHWPDLLLVHEPLKGAACARNRGVAETDAPWLLFLDCDCVPAPDWLAAARAVTIAPPADVMGGEVSVFDESPPPRSGAEAYETVFAFHNRHYVEDKGFSVTANMLTRRDVFEVTGPFLNGLSEDIDWCNRARAAGFRIAYAGTLHVSHPTRRDWPALERKLKRLTTELCLLNGTSPRDKARWIVRALAMPLSILPHAMQILLHPDLRGMTERGRGLATLVRLRVMRMVWMLRAVKTQSLPHPENESPSHGPS